MPDSSGRGAFPVPTDDTEPDDVPGFFQALKARMVAVVALFRQSTLASRGAAGTVATFHHASDENMLAFDTGSAWLEVARAPVRVKAYRGTAASIANAAWTPLTMESESYDTASMHTLGGNNSRLTAPVAGLYVVHFHVEWAGTSAGLRLLDVRKNAGGVSTSGTRLTSDSTTGQADYTYSDAATEMELAAGDYVEGFVWQNSGALVSLNTGDSGVFGQLRRISA